MNRNRKAGYLLLAGFILFFSACKTGRQAATSTALNKMEKVERIEAIQYQSIPFNTLSSSLRFSVKPGTKKNTTSANALLRIVKDQIIQLSLRIPILGTEVARMSITPEQVIIIDRTGKRYVSESIQALKQNTSFDFDFNNLQALLTNQLFIAGKSSIAPEDYSSFNWTEDKFFVRLNNTDSQGIHYDFVSDAANRIIQTEMSKKNVNMNWQYKDFGTASNDHSFPMTMLMELTVPNDIIMMNLTFNSVDIDTDFKLDTAIPKNYQRIEFEQIIKLIRSF